ncbi:proline oxidase [Colletotrichum karsti]|uniref:proline dehydrogenase n=1 Tax=Colletotrichum karsti TaxID=1095194 RepID=A0A9P6I2T4_9PEZI|nr:proline oxidase [Colletotrichum karsti]KAF9874775.1 proline oxidase [Colletotrichum karsti]
MKVSLGVFSAKRPWTSPAFVASSRRNYGKPTQPRQALGAGSSHAALSDTSSLELKPPAARESVPGYPLSVLSTGTLLRSLLVTTISSSRLLLIPSLYTLSFLTKSSGNFLLDVDRNPVLHAILKKTFYDQFCAGETPEQTKACVEGLKALGFKGVILTYAKETVFDHLTQSAHETGKTAAASGIDGFDAEIDSWRLGTLETAAQVGEGDVLAIKLTGAGREVTKAFAADSLPPQQMLDALEEIATTCKQRGIKIIVDAESQHFQKAIDNVTLELMRKFNRDGYAAIYNTYQAYLKSTPSNVTNHLAEASKDGFTLGLKLVRGAYILSDDRSRIHDTKQDTDDAYNAISQGAVMRHIGEFGGEGPGSKPFPSVDLLLASHNKESLFAALKLHQQRVKEGKPTVPIAFGQLHGMSDQVSFSLLQEKNEGFGGPDVYKCSTWGNDSDVPMVYPDAADVLTTVEVLLGLSIVGGIAVLAFVIIFLVQADSVGPGDEGFSLYKNSRFEECAARNVDHINCTSYLERKRLLPSVDNLRYHNTTVFSFFPWNNKADTLLWCDIVGCLSDYQVVPAIPAPEATTSSALFTWLGLTEVWIITSYAFLKTFGFEPHLPQDCHERVTWMWVGTIGSVLTMIWWWIDVFRMSGSPLAAYGMSYFNWVATWRAAQSFNCHPVSCAFHHRPMLRNLLWRVVFTAAVAQLGATIYIVYLSQRRFPQSTFYQFLEDEYTNTPGGASPCTAAEIRDNPFLFRYWTLGNGTTDFHESAAAASFTVLGVVTIFEMIAVAWRMFRKKRLDHGFSGIAIFGALFRAFALVGSFCLFGYLAIRSSIFFLQTANGEAPFVIDHTCMVIHVGMSAWRHFLDVEVENMGYKVAKGLLNVGL